MHNCVFMAVVVAALVVVVSVLSILKVFLFNWRVAGAVYCS